ncbi:MAG: hypothetical protein ABEJ77_07160 [Halanaeroarchaeum sp.]
MALHAVDDLTDAFAATRSFLLPVDLGRWLRLAVLSLFVAGTGGGGGSVPQFTFSQGSMPLGPDVGHGAPSLGQFLSANLLSILVLVLAVFLLGLAFTWLGSVFEFAFLESLRSEAVHVRAYTREYARPGTRLFAFRLVFGLLSAVVMGAVLLLAMGPLLLGWGPGSLVLLVLAVPVLVVVGILAAIAYVFTTAFVVPIMLAEDRGVLAGWRRLLSLIRSDWTQFAAFALVGLLLTIAIGILVGIASAIVGVVIAIPFALLAFGVLAAGIPLFNLVVVAVLAIPLLALLAVAVAVVQVPVQTYLRYWALLVLGDVDSSLDVIPDQRDAVRA